MFSGVCTVFNYYEYADGTAIWYPHILSGVHIETDSQALIKKTGPEGSDKVEVHVGYTSGDDGKYVEDNAGTKWHYLSPKEWRNSPDVAITFNPDADFIMIGGWDGESPVNDADYADRRDEGFYAYMNRTKDDVYKLTRVQVYNIIPHFELLGA